MKQKYTMTEAAHAARVKGAQATAQKFAASRRDPAAPRSVVRVSTELRNWAVDRFGNVDIALSEFKDFVDKREAAQEGVQNV